MASIKKIKKAEPEVGAETVVRFIHESERLRTRVESTGVSPMELSGMLFALAVDIITGKAMQ